MSFFEVKNISRAFSGLKAVDDVSFLVKEKSIKAVIGPNGAGKTTLFNLISGSLVPDTGQVFLNGTGIHSMPPYEIARHGISRTFQNIKLFSNMSVLENVMIGRHIQSNTGFVEGMFRSPRARREEKEIRERAMHYLDVAGISDMADHEATGLPFGVQRIVEIARALATEPVLLLLDEPAAGLNMHETDDIAAMITKIREDGVTVLVIEHDMSLIMNISDEIVVLSSGKKIAEGIPEDIQKNEEVIRVYLGDEDA